ncbi:hypothetical protein PHSC3_000421 [Chlamydiales bacterium STE3]|nr:hypothetical protein PHSC3_000421 [Chlamydiales bacterium STE3]
MKKNPESPKKMLPSPIHPDFYAAQELAYEPSGLICKNFMKELESEEYGAAEFEMNDQKNKFRIGKMTPKKTGQFVTLWKRGSDGVIQPYDVADPYCFYVVSVRHPTRFGQFVFPKDVLGEKGLLSKNGKGGKRAMRIYPPWNIAENSQAKKTQEWQLAFYFEINLSLDTKLVRKLFHC